MKKLLLTVLTILITNCQKDDISSKACGVCRQIQEQLDVRLLKELENLESLLNKFESTDSEITLAFKSIERQLTQIDKDLITHSINDVDIKISLADSKKELTKLKEIRYNINTFSDTIKELEDTVNTFNQANYKIVLDRFDNVSDYIRNALLPESYIENWQQKIDGWKIDIIDKNNNANLAQSELGSWINERNRILVTYDNLALSQLNHILEIAKGYRAYINLDDTKQLWSAEIYERLYNKLNDLISKCEERIRNLE